MRFLCVNQPAKAQIFGQEYSLKPLDPRSENIEDILVTDNTSAAELLERHPEVLVEVTLDTQRCRSFPRLVNRVDEVKPGGKVLIMKNGGIGDHLMLLPALQVFKNAFPPGTELWVAAQKEKHPLFRNQTSVDRLYPLPLTLDQVFEADFLIDFSSRDGWYDLQSMPMTDSYLNFLQIDFEKVRDKCPRLPWTPADSPEIHALFQRVRCEHPQSPLVLLNWRASNRLRDIPPDKVLFLARKLEGIVFVVAQSKGFSADTSHLLKGYGTRIFDCSPHMASLQDFIAAVASCDAVLTTDTGACHIAEALGRPSLVLYGPTRDDLWIRYYRKVRPLRAGFRGITCESPCGLTKNTQAGCPEAVHRGMAYSPCLLSISEERIESAFSELMEDVCPPWRRAYGSIKTPRTDPASSVPSR